MTKLLIALLLLIALATPSVHVQAATPTVPACIHVATADTIRIYYCEDIHLFVNQFGFMAFEP